MNEEPKKSALRLLAQYEDEARMLAADRGELEQQLKEDVEGTLAIDPSGASGDAPPGGPAPEARPLLRELAFEPGNALCMSGSGFRAMLYHVGGLLRLNEVGLLSKIERVASVSAGSIVAGLLGLVWSQLEWSESGVAHGLDSRLVEPLRRLAGVTIDLPRGLGFIRLEAPDTLPRGFDAHLFGDATLQNLPDRPGIVICATNLQSGALWRFSKPYMADYRVGQVRNPTVPLAVAVAASAAYSPLLMPIRLRLSQADYVENTGTDLQHPPFTTEVLLADGGIRDSLALEASWRRYQTVFVADGGGQTLRSHPSPGRGSLAPLRLVQRTLRINELVQGQVRSLYKRQLINSYVSGARTGTYWGLGTHIEDFGVPDSLPCRPERILELWNLPPRLRALDAKVQERLINWGYAVCDAAIRAHFDPALPGPRSFPYPDSGV